MAATRERQKSYEALKNELKNGQPGRLYLFYGEEAHMREYYIGQIRRAIVPDGFSEFNYMVFDAGLKTLDVDALYDAVENLPVMSERKLILVRDFDVVKPPPDVREKIAGLVRDLPEYVCLVWSYDTIECRLTPKNDIIGLIEKNGRIVKFDRQSNDDLIPWIKRRFLALDKRIETAECEYLIFLSGPLMRPLIPEIEKVAAHAKGETVRRADIDAVASRVIDAKIFQLTDELSKKRFDLAMAIFYDLIAEKFDPLMLLASVNRQFLRLYSAKLAVSERKGTAYLSKLWDMRSAYPAEKLLTSARGFDMDFIVDALILCEKAGIELKTGSSDRERVVELLILKLSAGCGATE